MGAVEDADLALFVGHHVGHHRAVEPCGLEWELVFQPCGTFDVPHAENFTYVNELVPVAVFRLHLGQHFFIPDPAGDNAVHQGGAEGALFPYVFPEALAQAPLVAVFFHTGPQNLAVVVDELAGQNHQARFSRLIAAVQHLGQLSGEGGGRHIFQVAAGVVDDARLGGVADHKFQVVAFGHFHQGVEACLLAQVQAPGHRGNDALSVHLFPVFTAPEIEGVQPLLVIDGLNQPGLVTHCGLNQHAFAVPVCLLVGNVKKVLRKGPQEIAFAELEHLFRCALAEESPISQLLKGGVT